MGVCETCGNSYDRSFTVTMGAETYTFDCFECAVQRLAPRCSGCDCTIIGHGAEAEGEIYCSTHCAEGAGVTGLRDRLHAVAAPQM